MSDRLDVRKAMEEFSWVAQYLCEPPPPLPPGTYCYFCSHADAPYFSDRCGNRACRVDHPSCPERDCGCIAHMAKTVTVPTHSSGSSG